VVQYIDPEIAQHVQTQLVAEATTTATPQPQLISQSGLPFTGEVVVGTTSEVIPQATTSTHDHE